MYAIRMAYMPLTCNVLLTSICLERSVSRWVLALPHGDPQFTGGTLMCFLYHYDLGSPQTVADGDRLRYLWEKKKCGCLVDRPMGGATIRLATFRIRCEVKVGSNARGRRLRLGSASIHFSFEYI